MNCYVYGIILIPRIVYPYGLLQYIHTTLASIWSVDSNIYSVQEYKSNVHDIPIFLDLEKSGRHIPIYCQLYTSQLEMWQINSYTAIHPIALVIITIARWNLHCYNTLLIIILMIDIYIILLWEIHECITSISYFRGDTSVHLPIRHLTEWQLPMHSMLES